ncbi:hypothetical protein [Nocardia cyriacigeorgica]|uniref:hypothetical protein n=1 Tax=Nocardia cyriacigeorgica TaxID=135487 RepID=UPI0024546579|nr:hypothetical protein [Nocardia cyriacigeorgica]
MRRPASDENGPGAVAAAHRASQTRNQQEEGPSPMIARPTHPDQPRCVDCGNAVGPWAPTGDRDHDGAQRFRCALGHGCAVPAGMPRGETTGEPAYPRLSDRQRDLIADALYRRQAQAEIRAARADDRSRSRDRDDDHPYVPQVGHRIEFYTRHTTPAGAVEIDLDNGLVQDVDISTGHVLIGDDDVPNCRVPLADVIRRKPIGLAGDMGQAMAWVVGNYGNTVPFSVLWPVLRGVLYESPEIQEAALRAAADRHLRRNPTGEPDIDGHALRCDDCNTVVGMAPYPVPPVTICCTACHTGGGAQ